MALQYALYTSTYDTVASGQIANDAVTTNKILDASVTAAKIGTDAVTTAKILDANITAAKLATDSVTQLKIADGAVVAAKLATDSVTTAKIAALAVTAAKADLTGLWSFSANMLRVAGTPSASTDVANKDYVDSVSQGLDAKPSVRALSDANINTSSPGASLDGVTLAASDRILLTGQTTASQNGIWVWNGAASALTRPSDFNTGAVVAGAFTFVEEGTTYADTGWTCSSNASAATVGTNNLTFVQFSAAGQISAGDGLSKTGNTLAVNVDNSSLQITSDTLSVKAAGIAESHLNTSVAGSGLAGGGGTALSVNVDSVGIEINTDTLRLKDLGVTTAKLAATSVTAAKLGSDVAGNGLTGGNGSALAVNAANSTISVTPTGISVPASSASQNGYMSSSDFSKLTNYGPSYLATGQTTNATATDIDLGLTVSASSVQGFIAEVSALKNDGSVGASYLLHGVFRRGSTGNASIVSGNIALISGMSDNPSLAATLALSTNNIVAQVTGLAATTMDWRIRAHACER